jgi:hypothetical protein
LRQGAFFLGDRSRKILVLFKLRDARQAIDAQILAFKDVIGKIFKDKGLMAQGVRLHFGD